MYRLNWFYPAFMLALGVHYLPLSFLYGMRMFAALGACLITSGLWLALYGPATFSLGAWLTAGALIVFAVLGGRAAQAEARRAAEQRDEADER
jgi:membrane protein implicated in regulation of membrane protease activity